MEQHEYLSADGRLEHRMDLVAKDLRHAVCPLFKPSGYNQPELRGCGVAYQSAGHVFLLTARHVVDSLDMNDFHIWTPANWIMSRGEIARTNLDMRGKDAADAAVIRLSPDVVTPHLRRHALTVNDLDPPAAHFGNKYLMQLISYPGGEVKVKGERGISPTWYQWAGVGAAEKDYKKRGRRTDLHAVFHFDRDGAIHHDLGRHPGPDMHGASGGGMWRMLPIGEDVARERWALLTAVFRSSRNALAWRPFEGQKRRKTRSTPSPGFKRRTSSGPSLTEADRISTPNATSPPQLKKR